MGTVVFGRVTVVCMCLGYGSIVVIDETTTVYRYNEKTTMAFLKNKFDTLAVLLKSPTAKQNINVSILDNG